MQPHGMLEPWALTHKKWRKRLAMVVYQRRDLNSAALLVATSEAEYWGFRSAGFMRPIALIPNGVVQNGDAAPVRPARTRAVRSALFLSRLHPIKGLLNLIAAWGKVRPVNWRLNIAGPDEDDHLSEAMEAVRANRLEGDVTYLGEIPDEKKNDIYQGADLFILPTYSENFGVVVAEALANGLPVITTKGAPWADLETYKCGWWIDVGVDPLVEALQEAVALSDEERAAMGLRGQRYVRRYNWDVIAQQTINAYRWIIGQGDRPDFVRLD